MKNSKKIAALFMAVMMVFACICPTMAVDARVAGTNDNSGSIKITNAVVGQTYTVYQILVLESYDTDAKAYAYTVADDWEDFIDSDAIKGVYVDVDDQGYVSWVPNADAAAFAKLAQAYAKDNNIGNQGSAEATSTTVEFTGLNLGYYLVDSTLGTLCSLNTTKPNVEIQEKNSVPTIDKKVKEGQEWKTENDVSVGDTVYFMTTVHAKKGAVGYVVHDQMTAGLTLNKDSIVVKVGDNTLTKDTNYTVAFNVEHDSATCDFEITFDQDYLDTITEDTDIIITYDAVLNENAVISTDSNNNKIKLDYGDESKSETKWSETKTYTYKFDLVKTKNDNKILTGAEFKLYDAQTDGNEIALVKESDGTYRVATTAEKAAEEFTSATIEAGKVTIKGLDSGTYWLEESKAPDGYNKLSGRVKVEINGANLDATIESDTWTAGGIQVVNQSGTELPSTGGIGTTIFYVVGSIMCVGAAVLLVTRKRMNIKG